MQAHGCAVGVDGSWFLRLSKSALFIVLSLCKNRLAFAVTQESHGGEERRACGDSPGELVELDAQLLGGVLLDLCDVLGELSDT